jgi:hypothetical protein
MVILCALEKRDIAESGWDVRVALSVYGAFSGEDYIKAQKLRYITGYISLFFFI